MIKLENISLSYKGFTVFEDLDFSMSPAERVAVLGPSGSGKTSLLRIIARLQAPDSGELRVYAKSLAFMFQEPRLLPWCSAAENVNLVLGDKAETMPRALEWLGRLSMAEAADKYPRELSGGMQQRTALARTLAKGGDLILLDEPFKAMDERLHRSAIELVDEAASGSALLLVTHNAREAEALGCRIIYMDKLTR